MPERRAAADGTYMAIDFHAHLGRPDPEAPPLHEPHVRRGRLPRASSRGGAGAHGALVRPARPEGHPGRAGAGPDRERPRGRPGRAPPRSLRGAGRDRPVRGRPLAGGGRALARLGVRRALLPDEPPGRVPGAPEAADAFALANDRSALVFIHPSESALDGRPGNSLVESWIGLPCDTGVCLSRMLLADTLSGHPDVRVVVAHSGGVLPLLLGRLDAAYEVLQRIAALSGGPPPAGCPARSRRRRPVRTPRP